MDSVGGFLELPVALYALQEQVFDEALLGKAEGYDSNAEAAEPGGAEAADYLVDYCLGLGLVATSASFLIPASFHRHIMYAGGVGVD